jgi:GNAT superfamily N-acetyltransferase
MPTMKWTKNPFKITDDPGAVDVDFVERMLRTSYWASERPRDVIERTLETSTVLSLFRDDQQIGFARVVSDEVTFAWICDLIIDPACRGDGLGKWFMECIMEHRAVAGTSQQLLRTSDAHELYAKYGFVISECMTRRSKPPK